MHTICQLDLPSLVIDLVHKLPVPSKDAMGCDVRYTFAVRFVDWFDVPRSGPQGCEVR